MPQVKKLQATPVELPLIIGILSNDEDYKVSWAINESLNIQLSSIDDIAVTCPKKNTICEFPAFEFIHDERNIRYLLVNNKMGTSFFLDEFKNINFLFFIWDSEYVCDKANLVQKLKNIPAIHSVLVLDLSLIKNKNRLSGL